MTNPPQMDYKMLNIDIVKSKCKIHNIINIWNMKGLI